MGRDPVQDPCEIATLPKCKHNTHTIPQEGFGDVSHYDIMYGYGTAIAGIKYAILLVARGGRMILEYDLHSLTEDEIILALYHVVRDIGGRKTHRMIADRDLKLVGGKIEAYLGTIID